MNKFLVGLLVIVGGGLAGWYFMNGGTFPKVMPKNIDKGMTTQTTPAVSPSEQTTTIPDSGSAMVGGTKGGVVSQSSITYTESGFSPAAITVKKGTSVTFENNNSTLGMWVASDVHPTHQLLPGFDAKKSLIKGSVYTYTFAKVGTWTFHNHASPTHTGKVVVTE